MEYHAELRDYVELSKGPFGNVYCGNIYEDSKLRFHCGARIRTSLVVKVENDILHTMNTRYKLVNKLEGNK